MRTTHDAIEAARIAAGLSKRKLAESAGMVPSTLLRKLRGDFPFDVDEIAALAVALGCPIADLWPEPNGDVA
jgi:transcriptional regulator with XRE-family HTH domain